MIRRAVGRIHICRKIDSRAVVSSGAVIGQDVSIGPFSVIGPGVKVGSGSVIGPHAVIEGATELGEEVKVGPFSVIGGEPQDKKWSSGDDDDSLIEARSSQWNAGLVIGAKSVMREGLSVHIGTVDVTRIGSGVLLMGSVHVAHDVVIGDRVVVANGAGIAGHAHVGPGAVIGGGAGVRQKVVIGREAMIGGLAAVTSDVLPWTLVAGNRASLHGLNLVGLRRAGVPRSTIKLLGQGLEYLTPGVTGRDVPLDGLKSLLDVEELEDKSTFAQRAVVLSETVIQAQGAERSERERDALARLHLLSAFALGAAFRRGVTLP